jgi:hypothetical protein
MCCVSFVSQLRVVVCFNILLFTVPQVKHGVDVMVVFAVFVVSVEGIVS